MATLHLYPKTIFGRNREEPEVWVGYVDTDMGTITSPTKASLTEIDTTPHIDFDAANDEIDLLSDHAYEISYRLNQTGAGNYIDIYNVTGSAVLASTQPRTPGDSVTNVLTCYIRTTAAMSISFRADDQTANGTAQTDSLIIVRDLGQVQL